MTETQPVAALSATAILFDMDGTLVDSTAVVERIWHHFANRHGLAVQDILAVSHGTRTEDTIARFLPPGADVAAETQRVTEEELADTEGIIAVPGADRLLTSLPEHTWALVTSAPLDLAKARMAAAGLPMPATVVTAEDVRAGKPDPEGYLAAAARLGVTPDSALVFEDAEAGVRAARASGAHTVVVGPGGGAAAEGLLRVADLRSVHAETADGALRVELRAG